MMPLLEILFWSFVTYYLFRFVFNFLLPVARATRHVRQQFRNMQDPMGGHGDQAGHYDGGSGQAGQYNNGSGQQAPFGQTGQYKSSTGQRPGQSSSGKAPAGDYIDFE